MAKTPSMNAREIALLTLVECERKDVKSEQALHRYLTTYKPARNESALATELVNGILRLRLSIDTIIMSFYHHNLGKASPFLVNILRIGVYQLRFLDRIPDWAAVSQCVDLARKYKGPHIARIANGVLRSVAADPQKPESSSHELMSLQELAVETSHPQWMLERWQERYGKNRTHMMTRCNNTPPLTGLRINTLKTDRETMDKALHDAHVAFIETAIPSFILTRDFSGAEPFIRLGLLTVQNPVQALPCLLLDPAAGETILDMCAAPGGKSTYLAELMQNRGSVIAVDRYPNKCSKIRERATLMDISVITTIASDARNIPQGIKPDRILLDAPCSGTGVLARRAELRWKMNLKTIMELVSLQESLLDHAAALLPAGGVLVYSTCSVEEEENTLQIDRFLEKHPEFIRESCSRTVPGPWREMPERAGAYLTLPGDHKGFDGGFAQRLKKQS